MDKRQAKRRIALSHIAIEAIGLALFHRVADANTYLRQWGPRSDCFMTTSLEDTIRDRAEALQAMREIKSPSARTAEGYSHDLY